LAASFQLLKKSGYCLIDALKVVEATERQPYATKQKPPSHCSKGA
jgi:hypothetical protein